MTERIGPQCSRSHTHTRTHTHQHRPPPSYRHTCDTHSLVLSWTGLTPSRILLKLLPRPADFYRYGASGTDQPSGPPLAPQAWLHGQHCQRQVLAPAGPPSPTGPHCQQQVPSPAGVLSASGCLSSSGAPLASGHATPGELLPPAPCLNSHRLGASPAPDSCITPLRLCACMLSSFPSP